MCGVLMPQWKAKCASCGEPIPLPLGPLGQLTRALETRRRVARFVVIFSVAMLALGWLPLLVISGMARHLVPLGRVVDYLPDAVLIISAGLGIGGGIVWAITDSKCVQLPTVKPNAPSEL